jgi:hypothetical protein
MPYVASYADDGKGLIRIGSGLVTSVELIVVARQQLRDAERCRELHYGMVDFSSVTEFKVVPEDARNLAELNRHLGKFVPRDTPIVIIASDVLIYAMARIWRTLTDDVGWISHVARTRADGITWLKEELVARGEGPAAIDQYPDLLHYEETHVTDDEVVIPE